MPKLARSSHAQRLRRSGTRSGDRIFLQQNQWRARHELRGSPEGALSETKKLMADPFIRSNILGSMNFGALFIGAVLFGGDLMGSRNAIGSTLLAASLFLLATTAAQSATVSVDLGISSQNFTLYGMGASAADSGFGTYTVGQGSSSFNGTTSTFTLSGTITGGSAGFNSGTYAFVTSYLGADSPTGGPNAPFAFSNPGSPEEFFYHSLAPSTSMVLDLFGTPTGDHVIPLVTAGAFDGPNFAFSYVHASCSGIAVCDQAQVGLTPGSLIAGPVTTFVSFDVTAVPEPSVWVVMLAGFGLLGLALRSRSVSGISGRAEVAGGDVHFA